MLTNELFFKENLRILGQVYKEKREEQGYSLRGVARSARVAHTVVSDIENGKACPNIETLQLLYETLSIDFCIHDDFLLNMKQTMKQVLDAVYYRLDEQIDSYLSILKAHDKRLHYSPLRVDYQLIKAIGSIEKTTWEKPSDEWLSLDDHRDYLSLEQTIMLGLTKGIYYFKLNKLDEAVTCFKQVLSMNNNDRYKGMALQYLAKISDYHYHNHPSFNQAKEASVIFTYHQNARRKMATDLLMAKKAIDIAYYDEAENVFQNLEYTFRLNHDNKAYQRLFTMLKSYLSFVKGDRQEAITLIDDLELKRPLDLFYKAYLYYENDDRDQTIDVLKKILKMKVKDNQKHFVASAYVFLDYLDYEELDASTLEHAVDAIANHPYNYITVNMHYFIYDLLIHYFEKHGRQDEAVEVSKKWIEVAKKRDFYATNLD